MSPIPRLCSLLIICSLSAIVAQTCTCLHWWFWHPGSAVPKKGTEQWDVIVLKCAQQETLLHHALRPRLQGLNGLIEFSCSLQFIINQVSLWLPVLPSQLVKKNKGKGKKKGKKEKQQLQNIHCAIVWTRKRKKCPQWPWNWQGSPTWLPAFGLSCRAVSPSLSQRSPVYNHRSKWWKA